MDQKEIVHRYYMVGHITLDKLLKLLTHFTTEGLLQLKDQQFGLTGEQGLYKLMNRSEPLSSASLNEKVDLAKLKAYLSEQGLPFAFKKTKDGRTNLYFRIKDKELAKKALERVIIELKKNSRKVLRTPGTMTFEEKLAYAQKNTAYKGIMATPKKMKGRSR